MGLQTLKCVFERDRKTEREREKERERERERERIKFIERNMTV